MRLRTFIQAGIKQLKAAQIEGAQTDVELIVAFVLKVDRVWLLSHSENVLEPDIILQAQAYLDKRAARLPLSYVLEKREFAGLDFKIDARALTPRVETETIVAEVVQRAAQKASVLDMGTGSGAMAIALKHLRPDLMVTASEVSRDALDLARENSTRLLKATDAIDFVESDLFMNIDTRFDIIVANLPYVTRTMELMPEVQAEPDIALFGGADDGLDLYRRFFTELPQHLHIAGMVWLESDPWQQPAIIELAAKANLKNVFQDYFILGFASQLKNRKKSLTT